MLTSLLTSPWPVRLTVIASFLFALLALTTAVAYAIQRACAGYRIFAIPLRPNQERRELRNAVVFNTMAALAFTALTGADLGWTTGWLAALITFITCFFGFEIYYYLLHRAMHTRALIRIHREHHESHVNTPLTAFSMSIPEGLGWIVGYASGPLLLALLGAPVSLLGFALYLVGNYWGNVGGHVNTEFFPEPVGRRENSWLVHPIIYHSLHHARYTGHFGFGTSFMDRLFGSEWSDWSRLHARVLAGSPLTSLKHRG
jgi:lathosterol oxidase